MTVAMISKRPDDPAEREAWVTAMTRIQVAMWIDGKFACEQCRKAYESVDDFLFRNPRYVGQADDGGIRAVDDECWTAYEARP